MLSKHVALSLCLLFLLSCADKRTDEIVVYRPQHPHAGDVISVKFFPQRIIAPQQEKYSVYLICQLYAPDDIITRKIKMEKHGQHFETYIKTNQTDCLLSLKFEDDLERCEDNGRIGWNILLHNKKGGFQRNALSKLGSIYSGFDRNINFPDFKKALNYYRQELVLFPDNYLVWFDLWLTELKSSASPTKEMEKVQTQLDSLLSSQSQSQELLVLAFKTNLHLLNKVEQAIKIGEQLVKESVSFSQKDEILYSLIFLKAGANQAAVLNNLEHFVNSSTNQKFLIQGYHQLGEFYRQQRNSERSAFYFEALLKVDSSNVAARLILANLFLKSKTYQLSQQMLDESLALNTSENVLASCPWERPEDRIAKQNLTQCQIFSAQALLEEEQNNFAAAINCRKKNIELRTPFPAYEWEKIGDIFWKLRDIDQARFAYVKALSLNPTQDGAYEKMKMLFFQNHSCAANFETSLQQAIREELKASAQPAPKVILADLSGEAVELSQQQGKITILIFWDTWSEACQKEIPNLNDLLKRYEQDNKVSFWAISVEEAESVQRLQQKLPFLFRQFHSGLAAKKAFSVIGFPTHFIIDAQGDIRFSHVGFSDNIHELLTKEIQMLLAESETIL